MAQVAGVHSERLARVASLLTSRGRKELGRFTFEGPTLLDEALRSGTQLEELFVSEAVLDRNPVVRELEAAGVPVFTVDDRAIHKISDLDTPTGLVAVAPARYVAPAQALEGRLTLILADLNDPANVGTLLRSAEAFGAAGVILGPAGVDPYHPKVVRGAMGAVFRLRLCVCTPDELAAQAAGVAVLGLDRGGRPLPEAGFPGRTALVVGHERRGLGA